MAPSAPTYLESVGDGPPVVLVHGVGLDHTMWRRLIGQLPQDRRYITYDMWGHGRTPRFSPDGAGPRAPALGDFTRQLADVIAAGTAEPPVLIGFSMGALVALDYAREAAPRLRRLVLLNSVFDRPEPAREAVRQRVRQAEAPGDRARAVEASILRWFTPSFQKTRPDVIDAARDRLRQNDPAGFLDAYRIFAEADRDLVAGLEKVTCPTLIATGALDVGSTPDMTRRLAAALPDAKAEILPDLAHMAPVEGAAAVARLLADDWL